MAKKPTSFGYKPVKPEHPKNPLQAANNRTLAITALQRGVCLSLRYHGYPRVVDVHTVGITQADRPAMSAFQIEGQSESQPVRQWRLLCFDECFDVALSDRKSTAPHPDYKKGAKQFKRIDAEF